jgi:quercetin dioxygenase-like cupin family protein
MNRLLDAGRLAASVLLVVALMAEGLAIAQQPGFVVTPLLRTDLSGDPGRVVVIARGEFAPGAATGRHSHAGDEYATVIEGTLEVAATGQPPRRYVVGEAYHNARGVVHDTRNVGQTRARVVSTLIVDAGRPLIEPAD